MPFNVSDLMTQLQFKNLPHDTWTRSLSVSSESSSGMQIPQQDGKAFLYDVHIECVLHIKLDVDCSAFIQSSQITCCSKTRNSPIERPYLHIHIRQWTLCLQAYFYKMSRRLCCELSLFRWHCELQGELGVSDYRFRYGSLSGLSSLGLCAGGAMIRPVVQFW